MAAEEEGQERTEEATPRRLEKAREEGQVARSRELGAAFVVIAGIAVLMVMGEGLTITLEDIFRDNFSLDARDAHDEAMMFAHLRLALLETIKTLAPFFMFLLVAGIASSAVMGGVLFSGKALMPKFSRLNPLEGIKRMFSVKALVELVKSILKVSVLTGIALLVLNNAADDLFLMGNQAVVPAMAHAMDLLTWSTLYICAGLILIAAVDVPYQLWDYAQNLKMTMQQVKDEMKDIEGKPEVKGRIRQLQREMARRRMMQAVPEADVVITNPTHFAVALKYDTKGSGAPVLVAKGVDVLALKIREIANAHKVAVVEAPALARAVYFTTEVDQEIPQRLYVAVARVLAYVFQLRSYRPGKGRKPILPNELGVPSDLRFEDR